MVKPESRRVSATLYSLPTMVEMFGLNMPLPTMMVARPNLNTFSSGKAIMNRPADMKAGAYQDRALGAQHAVGHVAAEQRARIHQRQVGAINQVGGRLAGGVAVVELRHDVQHQRPTNAVDSEASP